ETSRRALDHLHTPPFLAPDLGIRRKQAALGVTIAAAGVDQAGHETIYAVTRLYYSIIFAREQVKMADDAVGRFDAMRLATAGRLKKGERTVSDNSVSKVIVYLRLAESRQSEARQGAERATAALREALGLEPDCCLQLVDETLPVPQL